MNKRTLFLLTDLDPEQLGELLLFVSACAAKLTQRDGKPPTNEEVEEIVKKWCVKGPDDSTIYS